MKAIGFIGYSNSGKTTLIEKLIPLFIARGLRVAAIKNAHHGFDMDRPGKDSFRYRDAGAQQVLIATASTLGAVDRNPHGPQRSTNCLGSWRRATSLSSKAFSSEGAFPRIEVRRTTNTEPPFFPRDPNVVARRGGSSGRHPFAAAGPERRR